MGKNCEVEWGYSVDTVICQRFTFYSWKMEKGNPRIAESGAKDSLNSGVEKVC